MKWCRASEPKVSTRRYWRADQGQGNKKPALTKEFCNSFIKRSEMLTFWKLAFVFNIGKLFGKSSYICGSNRFLEEGYRVKS